MKTKLFLLTIILLFFTTACVQTNFFGVPRMMTTVPPEFGDTEALVKRAEKSPGAQHCPEKIANARKLGKMAVEAYWACRTDEALGLLETAHQLAGDAMLCGGTLTPAPKPKPMVSVRGPLDSDKDGVYDNKDACPRTPMGAKVDAWGCWVVGMVYFDTNKHNIKSQYAEILDEVASVMKKNPSLKLEVEGHTDNRASEKYNQALSENRANAVISYLIQSGVARMRITGKGYGLKKPATPNTSRQNMAMNRRVELTPMR